jgi:uroporphyrinogen decarboxylase
VYYSRGTRAAHWELLKGLPLAGMGVDCGSDLAEVLENWSLLFSIQGNIDPQWLLLPRPELESRLRELFGRVRELPASFRAGWVCGLGHGVPEGTPEDNVRLLVGLQREIFGE